jgi:phospholipid/cholesterol/gamma-HCH transport system substrate-binding protein
MGGKVNYPLVGLFVVVLGAGLIAAVGWLLGHGRPAEVDRYVTYMTESVSGLNADAPVKYRGVPVGRVADIALDRENPERVRLALELRADTPVKTDTTAILTSQGITGIAYVELTGGRREAPLLRESSDTRPPVITSGPSLLVRLDRAVTETLTGLSSTTAELGLVADNLNALLEPKNRESLSATLSNVQSASAALAGATQHMAALAGNTARASERLPTLVSELEQGAGSARRTAAAVSDAARSVQELVDATRSDLQQSVGDAFVQLGGLVAELQTLTETLERTLEEFRRNPNMLLFGRPQGQAGPGERQRR